MPQIILKERTAHLGCYIFLQEMLINIKTRRLSLATFVLLILQSF